MRYAGERGKQIGKADWVLKADCELKALMDWLMRMVNTGMGVDWYVLSFWSY